MVDKELLSRKLSFPKYEDLFRVDSGLLNTEKRANDAMNRTPDHAQSIFFKSLAGAGYRQC
jgi:hypothetical protein